VSQAWRGVAASGFFGLDTAGRQGSSIVFFFRYDNRDARELDHSANAIIAVKPD